MHAGRADARLNAWKGLQLSRWISCLFSLSKRFFFFDFSEGVAAPPPASFFAVSARGRSGAGGFGSAATAAAERGAGVHVYDSHRWGAAVVRVPGFDAGVYGEFIFMCVRAIGLTSCFV